MSILSMTRKVDRPYCTADDDDHLQLRLFTPLSSSQQQHVGDDNDVIKQRSHEPIKVCSDYKTTTTALLWRNDPCGLQLSLSLSPPSSQEPKVNGDDDNDKIKYESGNDHNKESMSFLSMMQKPMIPTYTTTTYELEPVKLMPGQQREFEEKRIKVCSGCNTTSTPCWRRGPSGPRTLCNACGIRKSKQGRKEGENGDPNKKKPRTRLAVAKMNNKKLMRKQKTNGKKPDPGPLQRMLFVEDYALSLIRKKRSVIKQQMIPEDVEEGANLLMVLKCKPPILQTG